MGPNPMRFSESESDRLNRPSDGPTRLTVYPNSLTHSERTQSGSLMALPTSKIAKSVFQRIWFRS